MIDWLQLTDGSALEFHEGGARFEKLTIGALAHHMALVNRWGGASREPYTVAQHCLSVARFARRAGGDFETQAHALLHDAHEPFLGGDMPTPAKRWLRALTGVAYDAGADMIDAAIFSAFNLNPPNADQARAVHEADRIALAMEARDLLPGGPRGDWASAIAIPDGARVAGILPWRTARDRYAFELESLLILLGKLSRTDAEFVARV